MNKFLFNLAIKILVRTLRKDPGYFYAWQSNIAVQFQDECARERTGKDYFNKGDIHRISNNAANKFLRLLMRD